MTLLIVYYNENTKHSKVLSEAEALKDNDYLNLKGYEHKSTIDICYFLEKLLNSNEETIIKELITLKQPEK